MKYNLNWLLEKANTEERLKYLFFWGHRPNANGELGASCLSQWWEQAFEVAGITYATAEHWMMAEKARLFKDETMLAAILAVKTPGEAKKLGRMVQGFSQEIWLENRYNIVLKGNLHKFGQHQDLKNSLLATSNRVLVEVSPFDRIWGIGLTKDAPNVEDPTIWKGLNLLGFALMEVRDMLQ